MTPVSTRAPRWRVVLSIVVALAWHSGTEARPWSPPKRVLFVVIDTLRPDHLGCYGYDRPTSPTIDALARDGALFLNVRSTSAWTKPAIASLFSGVGPLVHGVEKGSGPELRQGRRIDALNDAWVTLPEAFRRHGFATLGFCANPHVAASTGLGQGFDRLSWSGQRGDGLLQQVLAWLDAPVDIDDEALRRYVSSPRNRLTDWRRLAAEKTPGIDVQRFSDRLAFRPAPAANASSVKVSIPLGTVPASASGRYLLLLRARRDSDAKARVLAFPSPDPGSGVDLLSMRFSSLEQSSVDYRVVELEGGDELEVVLETTLGPEASLELHEAVLVPESDIVHAERWFAYLHFMHTHLPYPAAQPHLERFPPREGPPQPLSERARRAVSRQQIEGDQDLRIYQAHYDAAIHQVDDQLGQILRRLETLELLDETAIIVTSDHGEEFLDHQSMNHGHSLYDELLRIPLVLHFPGGSRAGRQVASPASILDLYPTMIDLMGWNDRQLLGEPLAGRSLLPALLGTDSQSPRAPSLATHTPIPMDAQRRLNALIDSSWKLIQFEREARFELYDLARDPREQENLATEEPEMVKRLAEKLEAERQARQRLRQQLKRSTARQPLSKEAEKQLRSLGYID